MRKLIIILLLLFVTGCSAIQKFEKWSAETWTTTIVMDYDGDGDLDRVVYHYTLYPDGELEVWVEVIG